MIDVRLFLKDRDYHYRQGIRSLAPIFISIIYYGYGLAVVYRCHHFGIYIVGMAELFLHDKY